MIEKRGIYRIIDANLNRTMEGLRVCEDIARFVFNDSKRTLGYKNIRHQLVELLKPMAIPRTLVVRARNIMADVGKKSIPVELQRKNVKDVFYANSQRAKESVRVLEEFSKLHNGKCAQEFKKIRYQIYALEKDIVEKF